MKETPFKVYVLEIASEPVFAFAAQSHSEAYSLTKEQWLKEDLSELTTDGVPVYTSAGRMTVRHAAANEMSIYLQALESAEGSQDLVMAYLIPLDVVRKRSGKPPAL